MITSYVDALSSLGIHKSYESVKAAVWGRPWSQGRYALGLDDNRAAIVHKLAQDNRGTYTAISQMLDIVINPYVCAVLITGGSEEATKQKLINVDLKYHSAFHSCLKQSLTWWENLRDDGVRALVIDDDDRAIYCARCAGFDTLLFRKGFADPCSQQ